MTTVSQGVLETAQRDALEMPAPASLHIRTSVHGRLPNLLILPNTILSLIPIPTSITCCYLIAVTGKETGRKTGRETENGIKTRRRNLVRRSSILLRIERTAQPPTPLRARPLADRPLTVLWTVLAPRSEGGPLLSRHLQTSLKGYEKTTTAPLTFPHAHLLILGTEQGKVTCLPNCHLPQVMSQISQPLYVARFYPRNLRGHHQCNLPHRRLKFPGYLKCPPLFLISRQLALQQPSPKGQKSCPWMNRG